jgi:hypothetical protein
MLECSQAIACGEHDQDQRHQSGKAAPQQAKAHRASEHVQLNKFILYKHIVNVTLAHGNPTCIGVGWLPDRPPINSPMASEAYQMQSNMDDMTLVE